MKDLRLDSLPRQPHIGSRIEVIRQLLPYMDTLIRFHGSRASSMLLRFLKVPRQGLIPTAAGHSIGHIISHAIGHVIGSAIRLGGYCVEVTILLGVGCCRGGGGGGGG